MRVLVTGHNGYIGSVMTAMLQHAGHQVAGLDTYLFDACLMGPAPQEPPVTRVDLRDVTSAHVEGFDAIVHLAALSNDPLGDLEPTHTYDINHHATMRLAGLARAAGVSRFLYSSSCSIYGATGSDDLVDESAPMRPVTAYAVSKVRVEEELHELADADFSPIYMRNATAYGFSPRHRLDLVLNDLVARAYLFGEALVLSDGTPWRPLIHIEDISRAFLTALEAPREVIHDQAFNVGSAHENYQVRQLAQIVEQVVPQTRAVISGSTGPDPRSYRVDFGKVARALPAFQPVWNARKGAEELHRAYVRFNLTRHDFENRFKRLPWLLHLRREAVIDDSLRWRATRPPQAA